MIKIEVLKAWLGQGEGERGILLTYRPDEDEIDAQAVMLPHGRVHRPPVVHETMGQLSTIEDALDALEGAIAGDAGFILAAQKRDKGGA